MVVTSTGFGGEELLLQSFYYFKTTSTTLEVCRGGDEDVVKRVAKGK